MNEGTITILRCLAVTACAAVSSWNVATLAGQDEDLIEQTIKAGAMAAATFSETRDKQAVLNLYTEDYQGIQDGESESKTDIAQWLSDFEMELNKGSTLRFIGIISDVKVHRRGTCAWTTYDYVFQAIRRGELEAQDTGKCTSLLRKVNSDWHIFHEHCSKSRQNR